MHMIRRSGLLLLAGTGVVALSACSPIEPWVKPYEREHLAEAVMSFRNP